MTRNVLVFASIAIGIVYIFFIPAEPIGIKITMKLIPMMLIILFALSTYPLISPTYKRVVVIGLVICMIADGVIYWFIAGLITFFIGHLFYIRAFATASRQPVPMWAASILTVYAAAIGLWIAGSQFRVGEILLGFAIIAYILVITTMGWMAIRTRLPLAIFGAILFIVSDSILAIDRFIVEIAYRDALVMGTYYSAQLLIAASIGSRRKKYSVNRNNLIH